MLENFTIKTRLILLIVLIIISRVLTFFILDSISDAALRAEMNQHDPIAIEAVMTLKKQSLLIFLVTSVLIIGLAVWIAMDINKRLNSIIVTLSKLSIGDIVSFQNEPYSNNETGQLFEAMKTLSSANKKISDALTSISRGDLTIEVKARSDKDALGSALVNMIRNLKLLIGQVQKQMTNLTTSSQKILNSIAQVATHSQETATTVTETTTAIEELKQTAHLTNENAQEVATSSEKTSQILKNNEELLQATMDEMRQISEKMYIISESIIKLNEQGKAIGNIIGTVNELSEQSNLLAVNAAIEAAKAGEYGKNFTVVAQEIRLLAEQSKSATIQVRSILNEIQDSTSIAVLATEQGIKAVEKGVKQSAETNRSMLTLSTSMAEMTKAANHISMSNQHQFAGVEQITVAMNHIGKATTELVHHIQQMESAVIFLNSIGTTVKEMTDQYVIPKEEDETSILRSESHQENELPGRNK